MFEISETIKELLSLTDLVLLDIKHINDEKCKELVGLSNKLELAFAQYLSDTNIPVWIRQVIIPSITDNKEDLLQLKKFLSTLTNVKRIELLPYHDMGKFKWKNLNCNYQLENIRNANDNDIAKAKEIILD